VCRGVGASIDSNCVRLPILSVDVRCCETGPWRVSLLRGGGLTDSRVLPDAKNYVGGNRATER
jgi:hypothetical protein